MQASAAALPSAAASTIVSEPAPIAAGSPVQTLSQLQEGAGAAYAQGMGAAWVKKGAKGGDVGSLWVEIFCASAAGGKWVPVDPLQGWVDRRDFASLQILPAAVEFCHANSSYDAYTVAISDSCQKCSWHHHIGPVA